MSDFKFKQGLIKVLSPVLEKYGYHYVGYYRPRGGLDPWGLGDPQFLFYEKACNELGVWYRIGVQLSHFAIPPCKREFRVVLSRARDPNASVDRGGGSVGGSLGDLLRYHFKVPIHDVGSDWMYGAPAGDVDPGSALQLTGDFWQFETQQEFEEKLTEVLGCLLKYGLPWLEDPRSEPLP